MLNKASIYIGLLLLPVVVAQAGQQNSQIQYWLEKMHSSAHMLNYEGVFVYGQHNQLSSMKIIHSVDKKGERERLISLDGDGREVIRDNKKVTCYLPDKKSVLVEMKRADSQVPPRFPMSLTELEQNYTLSLAGKGTVAGYSTQKINIQPKDNLRYGYRLWIEEETGLLLKTHLLVNKDESVEQFMFTHLVFHDFIPEKLLQPERDGSQFIAHEMEPVDKADTAQPMHKENWQVSRSPSGFKQDVQRMTHLSKNAMPVEHLVLTDGLATVSVFIEEKLDSKDNLQGGSHMGAVHAFGRLLDNHHVTVVGEVPFRTVKMIAESVKTTPPHD
ncbi:MAG: MucB/RseB C-terminal domain-containing protein [Gammaproteobacteria bacterium]|nr:MucB/RseB C-terminal domain-containing protein [Gammaproteobacteria bacterium]